MPPTEVLHIQVRQSRNRLTFFFASPNLRPPGTSVHRLAHGTDYRAVQGDHPAIAVVMGQLAQDSDWYDYIRLHPRAIELILANRNDSTLKIRGVLRALLSAGLGYQLLLRKDRARLFLGTADDRKAFQYGSQPHDAVLVSLKRG